jgi:hypothetical protein
MHPHIHLITTQILSEASPDSVNNKEIIQNDTVSWFTLSIYLPIQSMNTHHPDTNSTRQT